VASLSQGRTAAAQCGLFTHKSVPVIFEPPCITMLSGSTNITRQCVAFFVFLWSYLEDDSNSDRNMLV